MIAHPVTRILWVAGSTGASAEPFVGYLESIPHIRLERCESLPQDLEAVDAVLTQGADLPAEGVPPLTDWVRSGKCWLHIADGGDSPPPVFGVEVEPLLPQAEWRVLFEDCGHPLAERLPRAVYVQGGQAALRPRREGVQALLYADWHFQHRPVMTERQHGRGLAACTTLVDLQHPVIQRILYRWMQTAGGSPWQSRQVKVGILGYAPWLGQLHGAGVRQTDGLTLRAVCDIASERRRQACLDFPGTAVYERFEALARDPEVDLVVVATPPDTHAQLCLQLLAAGKHVVCEKPLALNRRETDRMVESAHQARRLLCCHQSRRWDPDFVALNDAVRQRRIGDLYYLETFVGGFLHPCGYWHSHAPVSGGTAYDWGAHYLDWIVSLMPQRVRAVVGTRHKRVWHDVTNADQERIQLRFEDGREAEFTHSDIAAARKPKWYALGTKGAIEGRWRDLGALQADPLLYFREDPIPATEMPPQMVLYRRERDGQISSQPMALPPRDPFGFHRNLADHLLTGEPLAAPLTDSVKVVAILEAAARSMEKGGTVEVLDG